ncbi:probable cytochrome P450 49a1 [Physella acuta]|uniref:probable cytochrome P450 49a1 n=1 Tax=Physella acuta TaxID=109671 RepID=UPI0027DCBC31|nr:probable cytochrome P450 49a1 [Physella acuta]
MFSIRVGRLISNLPSSSEAVVCCVRPYRVDSPSVTHDARAKVGATKADEATTYKTLDDMPGPEGIYGLPYIGSMFLFHPFTKYKPEKCPELFAELHRKYGRIVKFRKGLQWSVLLFDPDLIQEAISYEGTCPIRPSPPLSDACTERTGCRKGISQLQGEEWLRARKPIQEFLLQPSKTNQYTPVLNNTARDLAGVIAQLHAQNKPVPLADLMLRYAIESSALYCVNTRLGFLQQRNQPALPTEPACHQTYSGVRDQPSQNEASPITMSEAERTKFLEMVQVFMSTVGNGYYTFPLYKFFRTKLYNDFEMAQQYLANVIHQQVLEIAKSMKNTPQEPGKEPNLLQSLLQDGRIDLDLCVSLVTGFFSAATENISKSLGFVLWYLAKNVEKQTRLRAEIWGCSRESVTAEELAHLPYLKACLKESHRLTFPTPFGSLRVLPEDIVLDGYHIPAGTPVNFGHNCLGHSSEYFDSPEQYMPERWLKQSQTAIDTTLRRRQSYITMPFGLGKRNCLGRRLAEQQIYLALIKH